MWPHMFRECAGRKQSPIEISSQAAKYNESLREIKLINYSHNYLWNVSNTERASIRILDKWNNNDSANIIYNFSPRFYYI